MFPLILVSPPVFVLEHKHVAIPSGTAIVTTVLPHFYMIFSVATEEILTFFLWL